MTADRVQDQGLLLSAVFCPTLSTRLAGAWQQLADSWTWIGAMHLNTKLSFLKFEWSENRLCWQYACIFCVHLFLFVYVWKTSCWPCMRLWYCSITTAPQMLTDSYELESNHVSSYILFPPHLILVPPPVLQVAWPFQIKRIPLLIHSHKALTWSKVACSFDTQWQKSEAFS